MMNPLISLIIASVGFGLLWFLFWPKTGLLWKWRQGLRNTERVLIEDALKHLYDQEYQGLTCTLQSISGILSISGDQAANLMVRLESRGLVKSHGAGFELTSEGRSYALRMIRIHRLWERYFADETGISETEWHKRAEKLEHGLSEEEVEALSASVGNPSYDPHGDPIPTRHGRLPPKKGHALTELKEGEFAQIIHIEDEPNEIYAQLVAQRLHLGMRIQLLERTPHRIRFVGDGEENILAPVMAANVTVELLPKEEEMKGPYESLVSLAVGEKGEVTGISKTCRGPQRRRLMDLGVIPGTVISVERQSASGDPRSYNIRDASIALRNTHAELIHIKRLGKAA
jgi:DtxR family Mn-dependent transcriptional regulator